MLFYTIRTKEQREITIKKSRFIATIFPISSLDEAKKLLTTVKNKYSTATHHPYAYRIGFEKISERCSDDGEPPRSSGLPILQELKKANLTNIIVIVTRYFGGTKLGIGGLSRAYRESTAAVLDASKKVRSVSIQRLTVVIDSTAVGKIRNVLDHYNAIIVEEHYGTSTELTFEIERKKEDECMQALRNLTKGKITIPESKK